MTQSATSRLVLVLALLAAIAAGSPQPPGQRGPRGLAGATGATGAKGDTGATGAAGSGVSASGFALPSADPSTAPTTTLLYVRTAGNDTTGDGSIGAPYATLEKALAQGLRLSRGKRLDVDVTGLSETTPIVFRMPTFDSDVPTKIDGNAANWWRARIGAVNIFATPNTTLTISSLETSSQTAHADYNHLVVTHTHAGISAGALVGQLLWGTGGVQSGGTQPQVCRVVANTAFTITCAWDYASNGAMVTPLTVGTTSALFNNTGNVECLETGYQRAGIVISGVSLMSALDGASVANLGYGMPSLHLLGCDLQGLSITGGAVGLLMIEACEFNGNESVSRGAVFANAAEVLIAQSRLRRIADFGALPTVGGITGRIVWAADELSASGEIGAWKRPGATNGFAGIMIGEAQISATWIHDGTGPELALFGYGPVKISVTNSRIDNTSCTGGAIDVRSGATIYAFHATGSGNTCVGVNIHGFGVIEADSTTTLTGTSGDFRLGISSPGTWTNLANVRNLADASTGAVAQAI